MYEKILVAGGNGFLGKSVSTKLNQKGMKFISLSLRDGYDFRDLRQTLGLLLREIS